MNRIHIIIENFFNKDYPQETIKVFTKWFFFPISTQEKDDAMKNIWNSINVVSSSKTRLSLREIENKLCWCEEKKYKTIFLKWSRVAVIIFIPILSFLFSWMYINQSLSKIKNETEATVFLNRTTIEANAGTIISTFLPDGTEVYLNSGSKLTYDFSKDSIRNVKLIGEAYFKVIRNERKPFIVNFQSDKMKINVLGTEFNVKAYDDEPVLETTLVNGSVSIEIKNDNEYFYREVLSPSQKGSFDLYNNKLDINNVDVDAETSWKEGVLVFKDISLPLFLKRLSNYYNVKFEIKDEVINQYKFTGTFKRKQLPQILEYLKISSNIDYSIKSIIDDDNIKTQQEKVILRKIK